MKLKDLIGILDARKIGICADDEPKINYFTPNGWGSEFTIKRACAEYGEREVTNIYPMDGGEAIVSVA